MDWTGIIKSVAPTLGAAIGGPMGGVATKYLAEKFLGDGNADPKALEQAILSASPDDLVRIKELDQGFKLRMEELGVDLERIAVDDRKSARELAKANMWPQIVLSTIFIIGYFVVLGLLVGGVVALPDNVRDMANILMGVLTAGIPMILRFWFGGSPQDEAHMDRIYNSVPSDR